MHVYEVRPPKDKRGVDLISDVLPFGRLWYARVAAAINGYICFSCGERILFVPARPRKQQMAAGVVLDAAMTEVWVNFRYEYVSGVGAVFELNESVVQINVANRGGTEGVFRAFLSQENVTKFDSGDISVAPGQLSVTEFAPQSEADIGQYWGRIFTTSANLVPSMRIWRTQVENEPPISDVYFAPGDFAVFELPWRPFPPPPIGPAEGA